VWRLWYIYGDGVTNMARFEQFHVMEKAVLSRGWVCMVLLGMKGGSAMSLLSASVVYAKAKEGGRKGKTWYG